MQGTLRLSGGSLDLPPLVPPVMSNSLFAFVSTQIRRFGEIKVKGT